MKTRVLVFVLFGVLLAIPFAFAAQDYRSMSTEDLCKSYSSSMANPSEKEAYQQEWNRRMQSMSPQERQSMYQREVQRQRSTTTTTTTPSTMGQQGAATTAPSTMGQQSRRDYTTMSNEEFNRLCQNQQYMQGLTPEQRMEIDREWQRRIPYMTPEERRMYYPEGLRYYTGA